MQENLHSKQNCAKKCFYKLFDVWDTASVLKWMQQKIFNWNRMKKAPVFFKPKGWLFFNLYC